MSRRTPKAEVAKLLTLPIESAIVKGLNVEFPDGDECRVTHLPLDPQTLEVVCRVNLPTGSVTHKWDDLDFTDDGVTQGLCLTWYTKDASRGGEDKYCLRVTVTQCNSYLNAIKEMRQQLLNENHFKAYAPTKNNKFGNYALESADGSTIFWVRYTTVVDLAVTDDESE